MYLAREVTYHYDDDGCLVIKGRIPADRGDLVVKALEMAIETAYDPEDEQPVAARRADALCQVAKTYLANPEHSRSTADRYQVVIHSQAGNAAQLENGPCVSAETLERVSCDCCVTEIEENRQGEALNIGRRSRTIPPAMRRALKARDGGCRFPGCMNHKFVDGHHIRHWSKGGEIYFVDRRDARLAEYQQSRRVSIEKSVAWMYRKFKRADVSAEASKAQWYAGDTMDMEYAVWVLANIRQTE